MSSEDRAGEGFGFGFHSTSDEVVGGRSLVGKHFFITGTSSNGIGRETARALYAAGARVTMANRNVEKMRAAADAIREVVPNPPEGARLELLRLDLASQAEVKRSAAYYLRGDLEGSLAPTTADDDLTLVEGDETRKIDVLILNAAVMALPNLGRTVDGFEMQFGVNHFGHFTLGLLLLPCVTDRVVCVASRAHHMAPKPYGIALDDLDWTRRSEEYSPWGAYGTSKMANILFARELNRRLREAGSEVEAFSLHPGVIRTELSRHMHDGFLDDLFEANPNMEKTRPEGAATSLVAALHEGLKGKGGAYLSDCKIADVEHPAAEDDDLARELFEASIQRTGVKFPY